MRSIVAPRPWFAQSLRARVLVVNGRLWLASLVLGVTLIGCSDDGDDDARNSGGGLAQGGRQNGPRACNLEAPAECVQPAPVYADVAPVLEARCFSCHGGLPGQFEWPLTTYAHVASWRDSLRSVLLLCAMPPADSGIHLSDEEGLLILNWIKCNMPP